MWTWPVRMVALKVQFLMDRKKMTIKNHELLNSDQKFLQNYHYHYLEGHIHPVQQRHQDFLRVPWGLVINQWSMLTKCVEHSHYPN